MKQSLVDLIDAVRDLGIQVTEKPTPKCIKLTGRLDELPEKLKTVQLALEAVDRDGSSAFDGEKLEPKNDPERLKAALDGLLRLFQLQGGNLDEASEIVRSALDLEEGEKKQQKKKAGFNNLPKFAPDLKGKKLKYKQRLDLLPKRPSEVKFDDFRAMHFEVAAVIQRMGATYQEPVEEKRPRLSPGFIGRR